MRKQTKAFTLVEMVMSMGLWIVLLASFMASLFFGMRQMMDNYQEYSEYTRISLYFDTIESFINDKGASLTPYKNLKSAYILQMESKENVQVLYFYNENDKDFNDTFPEKSYTLVLSELKEDGSFRYGIGRRIMESIKPPPASFIELNEKGFLTLRVSSSGTGFGPFQTSILLKN